MLQNSKKIVYTICTKKLHPKSFFKQNYTYWQQIVNNNNNNFSTKCNINNNINHLNYQQRFFTSSSSSSTFTTSNQILQKDEEEDIEKSNVNSDKKIIQNDFNNKYSEKNGEDLTKNVNNNNNTKDAETTNRVLNSPETIVIDNSDHIYLDTVDNNNKDTIIINNNDHIRCETDDNDNENENNVHINTKTIIQNNFTKYAVLKSKTITLQGRAKTNDDEKTGEIKQQMWWGKTLMSKHDKKLYKAKNSGSIGGMKETLKCFDEMNANPNINVTETTYLILFFKFGRNTKIPIIINKFGKQIEAPDLKMEKLLFYYNKMLNDPNIEPTLNLYNTLIFTSGQYCDTEKIEYFLNELKLNGCKPNERTYINVLLSCMNAKVSFKFFNSMS